MKLFYQIAYACHQICFAMTTELTKLSGLRNQPHFFLPFLVLQTSQLIATSWSLELQYYHIFYLFWNVMIITTKWEKSHFNDTSSTGKLYKTSSITVFTIIFCTLSISSTSITYTIKFTNVHHCCVLQDLSSVDLIQMFRISQ